MGRYGLSIRLLVQLYLSIPIELTGKEKELNMKRKVLTGVAIGTLACVLLTGMFKPTASVANAPYGCMQSTYEKAFDAETGEEIDFSTNLLRNVPRHILAEKTTSGEFYIARDTAWKCTFFYTDHKGIYQSHVLSEERVADSSKYDFDELVDVYLSCNNASLPLPDGKAGKPVISVSGVEKGKVQIEGVSCLGLVWYGDYTDKPQSGPED